MEGVTVGLLGILFLLLFMLLLELPVAFAMIIVGFLGMCFISPLSAAIAITYREIWENFSSYGLTVIPLFMLMGNIAFRAGTSERLYEVAYKWMGNVRGGLAITTILACAGFASICGSNAATAATMSKIALPEMKKYGYNPTLNSGTVACGSTLGVVIPPSIVLVVYGLYTGQSIAKLFFASFLPGLILAFFMIGCIMVACNIRKDLTGIGTKYGLSEKLKSISKVIETIALFLFVMGGLYLGWFTPSEAGAAGAFGALMVGILRRSITWQNFKLAVIDTVKSSCMVMMLVTGAVIFGRFLTATRLPYYSAQWISSLAYPPFVVLSAIIIIYIIGGALMDALAFLLVTLPIFYPLIMALGYDPVWYGVLVTVVTTFGAVTPPVGISAYIVGGSDPDIPLETVFKGVILFFPAYFLTIFLLIVWPDLALFLPKLLKG